MKDSSIKILLLDDDPFMLKLLGRMLTSLGYARISSCDNGRDALALFENGEEARPDLILLDINMPDMDGLEFVRHLVDYRFSGSLILVSGEDERTQLAAEKLTMAYRIPVLGHLHKPVQPQSLSDFLDRLEAPGRTVTVRETKTYGADELRKAIANGELLNYYQPKVSLSSGLVVGVETLVRWNHPVDGIVSPGLFVGVAEAHNLIDDLTRAVLAEAFAQAKRWQDAGLGLHVAVNLSMDNLASLDFADFVVDLAARSGVSPQMLELEVTESRLMQDLRIPLEVLGRLRLKRFRLSIDDFGTGNSTLAQLRDLPFDELKIDQSFVHGAHHRENLRAMFGSSLGLAKQLGMVAVAEGVEDTDDWDFVRQAGCDIAQGYFIAKPMSAAELQEWVRSDRMAELCA